MYTILLACLPFVALIIVIALFTVPLLWGPFLSLSVLAHIVQYFKVDKRKDTTEK